MEGASSKGSVSYATVPTGEKSVTMDIGNGGNTVTDRSRAFGRNVKPYLVVAGSVFSLFGIGVLTGLLISNGSNAGQNDSNQSCSHNFSKNISDYGLAIINGTIKIVADNVMSYLNPESTVTTDSHSAGNHTFNSTIANTANSTIANTANSTIATTNSTI